MHILFLELPSPPLVNVIRDPLGGFSRTLPSRRRRYGFDKHILAFPPIFAAYTSAILESEGHECSIIDSQILDLDLPELLDNVEKRKPDVVVARMSLPTFQEDSHIISLIKKSNPSAITIGYGAICKVEPIKVLMNSRLDLVIRGELEFTLPEVVERLENKQSLGGVLGVSYKKEGKIINNANRPYVENLDALPIAAYHLLEMDRYVTEETPLFPRIPKKSAIRYSSFYSSRGCSYGCVYCGNPVVFGHWRGMSPERVGKEIEILVKDLHVKAIRFMDSCFNTNVKWAEAICDEIINRNLEFFWTCEIRADKLTEKLADKMSQAGCVRVEIGVETGDAELLKSIGKYGCTLDDIVRAFIIAHKAGLSTCAFLMVGLPGESWKTIRNTRKLLAKIKPDDVSVSITTPFPGTPLYYLAMENGWLLTTDWKRYTAMDPVMKLPGFSCDDVLKAKMYLSDFRLARSGVGEIVTSIKELKLIRASKQAIAGLRHIFNMIECKLKEIVS